MKASEIEIELQRQAEQFPERMSGNEQIETLTEALGIYLKTDIEAVLELLRSWLSIRIPQHQRTPEDGKREFWMWVALDTAKKYRLTVLKPDIEALVEDIKSGKTFLPYYAKMLEAYLKAVS